MGASFFLLRSDKLLLSRKKKKGKKEKQKRSAIIFYASFAEENSRRVNSLARIYLFIERERKGNFQLEGSFVYLSWLKAVSRY